MMVVMKVIDYFYYVCIIMIIMKEEGNIRKKKCVMSTRSFELICERTPPRSHHGGRGSSLRYKHHAVAEQVPTV